mmetsp:Transcript_103482/g.178273  ORF Transcript_103482/g.178273 Transcript_103482/m.178273 type:complete len:266 (+) Transcript_103482:273-1070(+)
MDWEREGLPGIWHPSVALCCLYMVAMCTRQLQMGGKLSTQLLTPSPVVRPWTTEEGGEGFLSVVCLPVPREVHKGWVPPHPGSLDTGHTLVPFAIRVNIRCVHVSGVTVIRVLVGIIIRIFVGIFIKVAFVAVGSGGSGLNVCALLYGDVLLKVYRRFGWRFYLLHGPLDRLRQPRCADEIPQRLQNQPLLLEHRGTEQLLQQVRPPLLLPGLSWGLCRTWSLELCNGHSAAGFLWGRIVGSLPFRFEILLRCTSFSAFTFPFTF